MPSDDSAPSDRDVRKRIRSLLASLGRNPTDREARLELVRQYLKLADGHGGEGMELPQRSACEDAVRESQEALLQAPADLEARRLLGEAYAALASAQDRCEEESEPSYRSALRAFEAIIRRRPFDPAAYRRFAWCSFWLGVSRRQGGQECRGQLMKAAEAQVQAMLLDPTYLIDKHMLRLFHGTLLTVEAQRDGRELPGPVDAATAPLRVWQREVRRAPEDPDVRARLGIVQLSEAGLDGNTAAIRRALRTFAKALRLDPRHFGARYAIGVAHRLLGERRERDEVDSSRPYRAAVEALREAARIRPDHPRVWVELGNAAVGLGKAYWTVPRRGPRVFRLALDAYERALALDPEDVDTRYRLGEAHHDLGVCLKLAHRDPRAAFSESARILAEVMRLRPDDVQVFWSHCVALQWLAQSVVGRNEDAREPLTRAVRAWESLLERDPDRFQGRQTLFDLRFELARAQAAGGDDAAESFAAALELARAQVEREPKSHSRHDKLSEVWAACAAWRAGRGEDPDAAYRAAIAALEDPRAEGRMWPSVTLDRIHELWSALAAWQAAHGLDARAAYDAAVAAQRKRLALSDAQGWWRLELAAALGALARWLHARGEDPSRPAAEWSTILEESTASELGSTFLGDAWLERAAFDAFRGADAQPALDQAMAQFRNVLARNRADVEARSALAEALLRQAEIRRGRGEDARDGFRAALKACEESQRQWKKNVRYASGGFTRAERKRYGLGGAAQRAARVAKAARRALGRGEARRSGTRLPER